MILYSVGASECEGLLVCLMEFTQKTKVREYLPSGHS